MTKEEEKEGEGGRKEKEVTMEEEEQRGSTLSGTKGSLMYSLLGHTKPSLKAARILL